MDHALNLPEGRHRVEMHPAYRLLNTNRYSVPASLIGRRVEVRESFQSLDVFDGPRLVASHRRESEPTGVRSILPEHRLPRGENPSRRDPSVEEKALRDLAPELGEYVESLKRAAGGRGTLVLRRLLQMVRDYPREPLASAVATASHYGLYDLDRLESMVLRRIAKDYFNPPEE